MRSQYGIAMTLLCGSLGLMLSACGGAGSDGVLGGRPGICNQVSAADGPGAGTAGSHGQPQRSDGEVRISQRDGQVVASRQVDVVNDFGGASAAQVDLASVNGNVIACNRDGGGYRARVLLEARANSEAEARSALDTMVVTHTDTLTAGTLRLNTRVSFDSSSSGSSLPVCVLCDDDGESEVTAQRSATIIEGLPASASYSLTPTTTNGNAAAFGLSGSAANLTTSNGNVGLEGRWDSANLSATNGIVDVSGDYASLQASAGNGQVEAALQTARSLDATLSATNGYVEAKLAKSSAGFDVQGQSANGEVRIDIAGTEAVGTQTRQSAHRRTPDYDSRGVQVQLTASATNGGVDIHQ